MHDDLQMKNSPNSGTLNNVPNFTVKRSLQYSACSASVTNIEMHLLSPHMCLVFFSDGYWLRNELTLNGFIFVRQIALNMVWCMP